MVDLDLFCLKYLWFWENDICSGDSISWHKKYLDSNFSSDEGFQNVVLRVADQQKGQKAGPAVH